MPLIHGNQQIKRFAELVSKAKRIDIAVAWATSCHEVKLLEKSGAKIRAVVGTSGNSTQPTTLRHLAEFAELRIPAYSTGLIFHPKYYVFHGETTICWIGSANLSNHGFGVNVELIHEFKLSGKKDREWFESLWDGLDPDPMPAILEYEGRYTPQSRGARPAARPHEHELPAIEDIDTWEHFVEGLRLYDEYFRYQDFNFDVFGETHSYLHTIQTGHEIMRLNDWANLTQRECNILRGLTTSDNEGIWGLLGWVRGGGSYVFNPKNIPEVEPVRMQIQDQISQILQANTNEVSELGSEAMTTLSEIQHTHNAYRGIGPAAASRWLTLARPDFFLSVNSASASRLGRAARLPQNQGRLAIAYPQLLDWLHERDWFNELDDTEPDDPLERDIWNCRAALVDAYVYDI